MEIRHYRLLTALVTGMVLWVLPDVTQAQGGVGQQDSLGLVVVVPNPYNVIGRTWYSRSQSPEGFERIRFANLPTPSSVRIYTSRGNLVITLDGETLKRDGGWNGRNADNQYIVSDVYLFVVESPTLGRRVGKFIVIR